jgi:hypothetical protein
VNECFTPSRDFAILYVAKPLLHATMPGPAVAAQRIATPLLRLAGLRRCYASPCRAKRGRCYVRRRLAEPLLRRAAPDRCYAPQYGSVAERSNALPDRYSLSGLRYSGRHDANPLLRTAAQRLTVATQFKTAPRSSWLRLSNAFQVGSSHDRASPSPITVHSNRPMPLFRH